MRTLVKKTKTKLQSSMESNGGSEPQNETEKKNIMKWVEKGNYLHYCIQEHAQGGHTAIIVTG
jgi:hypothetical protein